MWVPLGNPDNLPKALNFIMFVQSLYHVGEYIRRFWDKDSFVGGVIQASTPSV